MQILSKKRFKFGDKENSFVTQGGMVIETCPDWCAKDDYFKLCVESGNVIVIKSKAKAAKVQAEAAAK